MCRDLADDYGLAPLSHVGIRMCRIILIPVTNVNYYLVMMFGYLIERWDHKRHFVIE